MEAFVSLCQFVCVAMFFFSCFRLYFCLSVFLHFHLIAFAMAVSMFVFISTVLFLSAFSLVPLPFYVHYSIYDVPV